MCVGATVGIETEQRFYPKAYHQKCLEVRWTEADRQPLMTEADLATKSEFFRDGYHNQLY
jgi:hypothetical protein